MFSNTLNLNKNLEMIPQENPLQQVIKEYTKKRQNFASSRGGLAGRVERQDGKFDAMDEKSFGANRMQGDILERSDLGDIMSEKAVKKPKLCDFLQAFEKKVKAFNLTYKNSKMQFQNDMKSFKEQDIQIEEDMIEKLLNDTTHNNLNQKKEQLDGPELVQDTGAEPFTAEIASNNILQPLSNNNEELNDTLKLNSQSKTCIPLANN